jgi:WD40 repeat protein
MCAGPRAQAVPEGLTDFGPRGVLVAHMAEHQHAVNSLSVSHSRCHWFASASSDGTVKLWGCAKEGVHIDKVPLPPPTARSLPCLGALPPVPLPQ